MIPNKPNLSRTTASRLPTRRRRYKTGIPIEPAQLIEFQDAGAPFQDSLALFVDTICLCKGKRAFGSEPQQIPTIEFRRRLPKAHTVRCGKFLVKHGIILCDEQYRHRGRKRKALEFRFTDTIKATDFVLYILKTVSAFKRLEKDGKRAPKSTFTTSGNLTPLHRQLRTSMQRIRIDLKKARQAARQAQLPLQSNIVRKAEELFAGSGYFSIAESGRLYTSIANLPKKLRPCLYCELEGQREPLVVLDFSCFQPLLLCLLVEKQNPKADLQLYSSLTESGQLYDGIAEDVGATRKEVKQAMLTYLCGPWFDETPYPGVRSQRENEVLELIGKWFLNKCPDVAAYLKAEKTNDEYRRILNTADRRRR